MRVGGLVYDVGFECGYSCRRRLLACYGIESRVVRTDVIQLGELRWRDLEVTRSCVRYRFDLRGGNDGFDKRSWLFERRRWSRDQRISYVSVSVYCEANGVVL